jgi:hypothetical protein
MYLLGTGGLALVVVAIFIDFGPLASLGIASLAMACTLAIIRDNQRTRRMLKRPDERLTPMR